MTVCMKARYGIALAMAAGFIAMPAQAQYTGPSAIGEGTVAGILAKPVDDQAVQLQGYLLRRTGPEKYVFSDGTGEIVAEIDDKRFPARPVDEKTKVEIIGEVDTGLTQPPEIEVDSMRVVE